KPIREVAKPYSNLGGFFFNEVCNMLILTVEWINEMTKKYDEWEKSYNDSGRFDNYKRPGQKFLKLVEKAKKVGKDEKEKQHNTTEEKKEQGQDKNDKGDNNTNPFSAITRELSDLYIDHRPDKEIPDFVCSNHEY